MRELLYERGQARQRPEVSDGDRVELNSVVRAGPDGRELMVAVGR